jgi:hypothetical protein
VHSSLPPSSKGTIVLFLMNVKQRSGRVGEIRDGSSVGGVPDSNIVIA